MTIQLIERIDLNTEKMNSGRIDHIDKKNFSQFFTPASIAYYMSHMFNFISKDSYRILDPGAGSGNLTVTLLDAICRIENKPSNIEVVLYEIDQSLIIVLEENMQICKQFCLENSIELNYVIKNEDFLIDGINSLDQLKFDYIIINPPYKKLATNSIHKHTLLNVGINVPNYYAAFVSLAMRMMKDSKSELVCIIPRSFCNGLYFKNFRKDIFETKKIEHVHVFDSRKDLFYDDVLQETIILKLRNRNQKNTDSVKLTSTVLNDFTYVESYDRRFDNLVFPNDESKVIRIISDELDSIVQQMERLPNTLDNLGINVSTGPIVDFREDKVDLLKEPTIFTIPLVYPEHLRDGYVDVTKVTKKSGYLVPTENNKKRLRPNGFYVLVKRMSSKEESKRVSAAFYDGSKITNKFAAFENKVNYYHINNAGLDNKEFAKGLSLYLNSSLVDFYFRTYSGSTQVNVSDLRGLRYPLAKDLELIGGLYKDLLPDQNQIDEIMEKYILKQEDH